MINRDRDPVSADQLARYLFGDPLDPRDQGIVGRLMAQVDANTRQVRSLLRLAWAVLIVFIAAILAVTGDAIVRIGELRP